MHNTSRHFLAALFLFFLGAPLRAETPAILTVDSSRGSQTLSLEELRARLPSMEIEVVNPDLKRPVRYLSFSLADVLKLMGGEDAETLVFHCLDGYRSNTPGENINKLDLRLAYGEDGVAGKWSPISEGKVTNDPAPFMVISANSSDQKLFSWPYQMNRIEVISFARKFSRTLPPGVAAETPAAKGFALFKVRCLNCHSINLQGGEIGPELNIPRNITEYRSTAFLRQWLQDPSQFRARARMPAPNLTARETDEVLAYLRHMARYKQGETGSASAR